MNIIRTMILTILLATMAAFVAESYKLITLKQMLIINFAGSLMMIVIIIFLYYRIRTMKIPPTFSEVKVVIPKVRIDDTFLKANSELLKNKIFSTNPFRSSIFRISMEINNSIEQLVLYAVRSRESETWENSIKKRVEAKETYIIDTIVGPNESLNFKFDNDIDIKKLLIDELYMP